DLKPELKPKPKPDPDGETEPDPDPIPKTKTEAIAIAPRPRELPEVFIAPEPREAAWRAPLMEYQSKWQTVGVVDLRVAGLALTKVPFIDSKGQLMETGPLLVIVVEARMKKAPPKPRELQSWTNRRKWYSAVFLPNGKDLAHGDVPLGAKFNTGVPLTQPLSADGMVVRDLLFYEIPQAGAGELSLRLDAERCGESGDVWF